MAATQPAGRQAQALDDPVTLHGFDSVFGTAGVESAAVAQKRADSILIGTNRKNERLRREIRFHCSTLANRASSVRRHDSRWIRSTFTPAGMGDFTSRSTISMVGSRGRA